MPVYEVNSEDRFIQDELIITEFKNYSNRK